VSLEARYAFLAPCAQQRTCSFRSREHVSHQCLQFNDGPIPLQHLSTADEPLFTANVHSLCVADCSECPNGPPPGTTVLPWHRELRIFTYQAVDEDAEEEVDDNEEGGAQGVSYRDWTLPCVAFEGLWDALVFEDTDIKTRLLSYASTALHFSDAGVDPQLIAWNRCVLLHGPPGSARPLHLCRINRLSHASALHRSTCSRQNVALLCFGAEAGHPPLQAVRDHDAG